MVKEKKSKRAYSFADYEADTVARTGTMRGRDGLAMSALGLGGEAAEVLQHTPDAASLVVASGQVQEKVKKHLFHGAPIDKDLLRKELGDVLWYLSHLALLHGITLESVAEANRDKLAKRFPNGFSEEAARAKADEKPEEKAKGKQRTKSYLCQFLDMNEDAATIKASGPKPAVREYIKQAYARAALSAEGVEDWEEYVMIKATGTDEMRIMRVTFDQVTVIVRNQTWPKSYEEVRSRKYGLPIDEPSR